MSVEAVATRAQAQVEEAIDRLCSYLRYPAISCDPDHAPDVRALAARITQDLSEIGLDRARVIELPNALPIVAAEWLHAPGRPTLLIYGHMDLQPVKGEIWRTPPHEPTRIGERLYARGAADDMGGWAILLTKDIVNLTHLK